MILRPATTDDIPALLIGARQFAQHASPWLRVAENDADLTAVIEMVLTLPGIEVTLADEDGIVGGIGMLYAPYIWDPSQTVAEELFWFAYDGAPPGTGKMLFENEMNRIRERKAKPMFRALATSGEGVVRAYQSCGLEPAETLYTWRH